MNPHEFAAAHPHPGADPVARLRHVLDVYDNAADDRFAVDACGLGVYPEGRTGLTFGDLRAIADRLGA